MTIKIKIMKTIKKAIYLSLVCMALVVSGCSKNNDDDAAANPTGGSGGDEYLTAKVNGAVFEAAQTPAVIVSATVSNSVLTLHGGQNDGQTIRATINGYSGAGTYTTGDGLGNTNSLSYITINPVASWMSTFNIGSGTLNVSSDDGTTIMGTFSFDGFNATDMTTKNITEGTFKATLE